MHEIKKSKKMEKAHEMQTLYYLMVLKNKGVSAEAVIDYPLIKEKKRIKLRNEDEKTLEKIVSGIKEITSRQMPPIPIRKSFCPKCSYYDLCWSE